MAPELIQKLALPSELSLAAVKSFVRVYDNEHDSILELLTDAAVAFVERYTRKAFRRATYREESPTACMDFGRWPVETVDSMQYQVDGNQWMTEDVYERTYDDAYSDVFTLDLAPSEYRIDRLREPHRLIANSIDGALVYRWQYTAGVAVWPSDVILVVLQAVEEHFTNRGASPASAQQARFSRGFELTLDQHVAHIDAVRWI
ncbi:MAG TPA: hypothetical protein DDW52_14980 [Planctomycetaceae bacterium]|nr:hypothetical protein [Planctomycetaceae bacterium]